MGGTRAVRPRYRTDLNRRRFLMGDGRDERHGTFDPVTPAGNPQPDQPKVAETAHEKAQWFASMQGEPLPSDEPPLPEGLRRKRLGALGPRQGRRQD
jgi:hypothetical protein